MSQHSPVPNCASRTESIRTGDVQGTHLMISILLDDDDPGLHVDGAASSVKPSHMEHDDSVSTSRTSSLSFPVEAQLDEDNLKKIGKNAKLSEAQGLRWSSHVTTLRMSYSAPAVLSTVSPRDGLRENLKEKLKAEPLSHVSNLSAFLLRKDKVPHMVSPVETQHIPFIIGSKRVGGKSGTAYRTNQQNISNEGADIFSLVNKPPSNEHQRYRINIADDSTESDWNSVCSLINPSKRNGGNQDNWRETLYALIRCYGFKSCKERKATAGIAAQRASTQLRKPTQTCVQRISHGQRVLSQIAFRSPRKAPDEKSWHVIPMPWQQSFVTMMQGGVSQFGALELIWLSSDFK
ncbi:uncharacterized protein LOC122542761 [Chiloscyllium plagiosum]|uniref:uncharacterized protein LOC122542761 n=1 Tax=Chiloscyllium plagiosum TaxID=36176 RepID=UPI001CB7DFC7|nr:uncharacterized protein LOC122542761 [Chiloscyllium plagiosum]